MTKILNVDVGTMLRREPDCVRALVVETGEQAVGCKVEWAGPAQMVFDDTRERGPRVYVETEAAVRITNSAGQVKEIP